MYSILLLLMLFSTSGFFMKNPPFIIKHEDVIEPIHYNIPGMYQKIINKLDGFYGMIGPDVNTTNIKSLFDLFTGDGNIQGVFFDNGNITFIKHYIKTEKFVYEEKNGKMPTNMLFTFIIMCFNKLRMFPTIMGLANTALLQVNRDIYAMFERDLPYCLTLDFEYKNITTDKKLYLPKIEYLSGHSKYDNVTNTIDSIEYHVSKKTVNYYNLAEDFQILEKATIPTTYIPIVHDFATINDKILFTDSPFELHFDGLNKIPVRINEKKPTYIHLYNRYTKTVETFTCPKGFYVFHYASIRETLRSYEIYAPIYEHLDFSNINLHGKYRKIVLDKHTKKITIHSNKVIDIYNLDFPIKSGNEIILRNIKDNKINGFVICENLFIKKTIILNNKYVCGEPTLVTIERTPYIITFAYDNLNNGYLLIINVNNSKIIEIPLNKSVNIGFHSIFVPNNLSP